MPEEHIISLLRKLVSIPSVNPGFSNAPPEYTGEARLGKYLLAWAEQHSVEARCFEAAPERPCILLETGPKTGLPVMISAHMDTVWPGDMQNPFELKEANGCLYGLGTSDDKGPLAAALIALEELHARKLTVRFQVLATCDEEYGLCGITHMIPAHTRPALHIISEPTELKLVTAHKGSCRFTVKTHGISAHSSLVPQGENAIYKAVRLITALEEYGRTILTRPSHPLLGTETLSVGMIQGGIQPSIVPDECTFSFNYRTLPGKTPDTLLRELQSVLESTGESFEMTASFDAPPMDSSCEIPLINALRTIMKHHEMDNSPHGVPFAAESIQAAKYGIPAVLLGPGSLKTAHSPGECIEIRQLDQMKNLLVDFISS